MTVELVIRPLVTVVRVLRGSMVITVVKVSELCSLKKIFLTISAIAIKRRLNKIMKYTILICLGFNAIFPIA